MIGLTVVAALVALLFLPGGNITHDVSSYGVGKEGHRLGFELLEGVGIETRRFNHGVELLPDGGALWVLDPGVSLLDGGPAGMGGIRAWVERGNTLLLAVGGGDDDDWLRHHVLGRIEERRRLAEAEAESGAETEETGAPSRKVDEEELLKPQGSFYEAMATLGVGDVKIHGQRTPLEVGFDDPMPVEGPLPGVSVLRGVRNAPFLSGEGLEDGEVLLRGEQGPLVWRRAVGEGQVVLVSDGRLLSNWAVAGDDNGYLLVSLATLTAGGGPVLYEEFSHGYASVTTLTRLLLQPPALFLTIQVLVVLTALVAWRTRRFGPALPAARGDRRTKAEHVHALADLHLRGKHHQGAARRLRQQLMSRWRERFGGGQTMTDEALFQWLARRTETSSDELRGSMATPKTADGRRLLRYARRLEALRRRIEEGR